jgi:Transposase DDE domain
MKRAGLAATIKARWICEQAHQQLKEKLGLDHFEGRSWQGLHRHALMTMIAYAFLQHRHLTQVGRKKESTDRRLSLACRPYATPSSISFFDHYLSNAHTAEDEAVKNSGVGKSAKVVLGDIPPLLRTQAVIARSQRVRPSAGPMINSATKQSMPASRLHGLLRLRSQ